MTSTTLEQRVAALEEQVRQLQESLAGSARAKDWRRTIGMFTGDEVMKQIDLEALKYREADRRKTRDRKATGSAKKARK
jgi:hypothetical protein